MNSITVIIRSIRIQIRSMSSCDISHFDKNGKYKGREKTQYFIDFPKERGVITKRHIDAVTHQFSLMLILIGIIIIAILWYVFCYLPNKP